MADGEQKPQTTSEKLALYEDLMDGVAKEFAHKEYGIPKRAIRVILCPEEKFICAIVRGPTAVIRTSLFPWHPEVKRVLKNAVRMIYEKKMWESLEIEPVADILRRESQIKKNLWRSYQFDPSMLVGMPRPEEISVKVMTRVEATHRGTKLREIVEVESGSVFSALQLVQARLARRVAETLQQKRVSEMEEIVETHPWDLPVDHPMWVGRTN